MKKAISLFLCLLLLMLMTGCGDEQPKLEKPVKYYYCKSNVTYGSANGVLDFEERESVGKENDLQYLLNQYMRGPESGDFLRTFPQFARVIRCEIGESSLSLCLSNEFASLSGMELSLACAALTTTVYGITGLDTVTIRTDSALLDGRETIVCRYSDFLLQDNATVIPTTTIEEPKQ